MSDDIKLPELPEPTRMGTDCDSTMRYFPRYGHTDEAMQAYARAAVELNRADTARLDWIADGGRVSFDRAISMWAATGIDGTHYWADTMRKAIDNAISRYKPTPAPEHGEG